MRRCAMRPRATSATRWCRRARSPAWWRAARRNGEEPLTFGMTFPFSTHNYHLRFWMAAGGVDPDEDVRLVVLPPPYMVESLANGHVDAFCVGAPWNSVAVDLGIGHILHFVSEILIARRREAARRAPALGRGESGCARAAGARARQRGGFRRGREQPRRGRRIARGAEPHRRGAGGDPPHARRAAEGFARRRVSRTIRAICWSAAPARRVPIPCRRPGSMRRWCAGGRRRSRARCSAAAKAVWRPDLYDAALGKPAAPSPGEPADGIGAFAGPAFDPDDIEAHLAAWTIKRAI